MATGTSTRLSFEGQGSVFPGSASVTVSALTPGSSEDYSITDANAKVGDVIFASPSNAMAEAKFAIALAWCSTAGTVKIRGLNSGASGNLTGGANTINYCILRSGS